MNFENYYNTLSSHQDEINQINHLYLNITSKGLIMDEMPHVEPYLFRLNLNSPKDLLVFFAALKPLNITVTPLLPWNILPLTLISLFLLN